MRRRALAFVLGVGLAVSACAGSGSSGTGTSSTSAALAGTVPVTNPPVTTGTTPSSAWAAIDRDLGALGPNVGFLAARVLPDGTCEAVHEIAASTARPTGSQFKLWVLGALVEQVRGGTVTWDQRLTIDDATKSVGNGEGSFQTLAPGTEVTVEEAAMKMISISDNTATDMLIGLVGRPDVEAQASRWTADATANTPFLTTRQMLLLHYVPELGDRYLATSPDQRATFLASDVDPHPLTDIGLGLSAEPRFIDRIEWFASPDDICRSFAGLQRVVLTQDRSSAPLPAILSRELGTIGLDRDDWPTIWFKGGSEPGVLTLGWLATDRDGDSFVVQAMVSDPDAALAPESITDLVDIGTSAFDLLD